MKYKGAIFDLDGTLLNTIGDIADSVNHVLTENGYPNFTAEEYRLKLGSGFKHLIEQSLPLETYEETRNSIMKEFVHTYETNFMNKTVPYEGIDKMLDELNTMGIKIAVNSNKGDYFVKKLVNKYFRRIPFIGVYGEREGIPKKPDPAAANEILSMMGLESHEVIYIGDSSHDMLTGRNANMDKIGVLWGFRGREDLIQAGADHIVSSPEEIIDIMR